MAQLIYLSDAEARYEDMLDDCNEMVRIGSLEYTPSYVLKEIDPVAYREGFLEYVDNLTEDDIFVAGYTGDAYPGDQEEEEEDEEE